MTPGVSAFARFLLTLLIDLSFASLHPLLHLVYVPHYTHSHLLAACFVDHIDNMPLIRSPDLSLITTFDQPQSLQLGHRIPIFLINSRAVSNQQQADQ